MRVCAKCNSELSKFTKKDKIYCLPCGKEVLKQQKIQERWDSTLKEHLYMIKDFLIRNGIEVRTQQLLTLEGKR